MLKIKKLVYTGICWRIGDGESVKIWEDPWVSLLDGLKPERKDGILADEKLVLVSQLIDGSTRTWKQEVLEQLFDQRTKELISLIPLARIGSPDIVAWALDNKGQFSVRSCYRLLKRNATDEVGTLTKEDWKKIWSIKVTERSRHLLWRIASNMLPTRDRLQDILHLVDNESNCLLCNLEKESINHLFTQCSWVKPIWEQSVWAPYIEKLSQLGSEEIVIAVASPKKIGMSSNSETEFQCYFVTLIDKVWWARNRARQGEEVNESLELKKAIEMASKLMYKSCKGNNPEAINYGKEQFTSFDQDTMILDCDASGRDQFTASVVIARSTTGNILAVKACINKGSNIFEGELQACKLASELASTCKWEKICVRSDSQMVVDSVGMEHGYSDWKLEAIRKDCIHNFQNRISWTVVKINRVSNSWAHSFAQWAAANRWAGSIPYNIIKLLEWWLVNGLDSPRNIC